MTFSLCARERACTRFISMKSVAARDYQTVASDRSRTNHFDADIERTFLLPAMSLPPLNETERRV